MEADGNEVVEGNWSFSELQLARQNVVPTLPVTLQDVNTLPVMLHEEDFPIAPELKPIMPSLLG